jgi:hypothetical protein
MGVRLLEADTHLGFVRLHLHEGAIDDARASLDNVCAIVEATGYHRRDPDISALRAELDAKLGA